MGISRKIRRSHNLQQIKKVGIWCCNHIMIHESGLDSSDHYFFTCTVCGKHKLVKKTDIPR